MEALRASEDEVISMAGVDTATYLVFLSTVTWILILSGIILLPILIPVAVTDDSLENEKKISNDPSKLPSFNIIDELAMGNVRTKSVRLWAFLIGTWWVSLVTYYLLWKAYKHVSDLRAAAESSSVTLPEDYALLVRDIPPAQKGQSRKDQVDAYFRKLHPGTFYKSMIITDNKQATKIWDELVKNRKKLAHAEAVFEESKAGETGKPDGTRPECRTGFLGLIGAKVDSISHYEKRIAELQSSLEVEQKDTLSEKQQTAALVFLNNKPAAIMASQTLHAQTFDSWTVEEAPEPRQLIWSNLPKNTYERQVRRLVVYGVVFLSVVFYMIPITFISAFTTLENLKKLLPFLKSVINISEVKTVLEAYLPQLALILFLAFLPKFLLFLSVAEGIPSKSHAARAASGKYFYFIVFNVFLGVTIGGTLISSLKTIIKSPTKIVDMLGNSLPGNATFFITFVALKFFVGYGLELTRLAPLIIYHLKNKYMCKTEEERKEAWAPGAFGYATRVPNDMLIATICLCYSVIAPLILPFGVLYFGIGWLVARNQALKVYVPEYESNGRMWPHMFKRIMAAMIIYQITMIGYFTIKKFYYAPFVIPLPVMSFVFAYVSSGNFYSAFSRTPLEVACRSEKEAAAGTTPNMQVLYAAYVPGCLKTVKQNEGEMGEDDDLEDKKFLDAQTHSRSMSFDA